MKSDPDSPAHQLTDSPDGGDTLLVGRVARAHGNRGEVIVNLETDFPEERFVAGRELIVDAGGRVERRRITSARFHHRRPVLALEGVATMNDAEALAGAELKIPAADAGALPEHTYYRHDLVGCEVRDTQGRAIGRVMRVDGPLDRSILAVETSRGEALVPLVAEICVRVAPAERLIVVNPPEGLLDVNADPHRHDLPEDGAGAARGRDRGAGDRQGTD